MFCHFGNETQKPYLETYKCPIYKGERLLYNPLNCLCFPEPDVQCQRCNVTSTVSLTSLETYSPTTALPTLPDEVGNAHAESLYADICAEDNLSHTTFLGLALAVVSLVLLIAVVYVIITRIHKRQKKNTDASRTPVYITNNFMLQPEAEGNGTETSHSNTIVQMFKDEEIKTANALQYHINEEQNNTSIPSQGVNM